MDQTEVLKTCRRNPVAVITMQSILIFILIGAVTFLYGEIYISRLPLRETLLRRVDLEDLTNHIKQEKYVTADKTICPNGYTRFFDLEVCISEDAYISSICPHPAGFQKISECVIKANDKQACPGDWIYVSRNVCIRDHVVITEPRPDKYLPSGYRRLRQVFINKISPMSMITEISRSQREYYPGKLFVNEQPHANSPQQGEK